MNEGGKVCELRGSADDGRGRSVFSPRVCLEELSGAGGGKGPGWFLGENVTEKRPVGPEPGREYRTM